MIWIFVCLCLLVLVVLQNLVAVVLDGLFHFLHELGGLRRKEPTQAADTICDSSQVVEQWGGAV